MTGTSTGEPNGAETIDWHVEPDRLDPPLAASRALPRRHAEERAHSLALAVATALLFVLVAGAVMFGGHAALSPLLHHGAAVGEAEGTGDVVYAMPDGVFCRHMAFDNATAEVTRAAVEPCPASIAGAGAPSAGKFDWGHR